MSVTGCGRWGGFIARYLDSVGHRASLYGREGSETMRRLLETTKA